MPNDPGSVPKKAGSSRDAIKIAAFVGALVGALLARPILRPWLEAHVSGLKSDWPFIASIVPWVVFSLYWEIAAKNSAPAVKSESKASRSVHVVLTNIALLLIIAPIRSLNQQLIPDLMVIKLIGLAIECAGLGLAIWARRVLGRNWSGEITIKEDHELIRSGPYATVRHPIYTALLTMYVGTAIVSGETHALIGLVVGIVAYLRKTRMEEINLDHAFGQRYNEYRKETWAIMPGFY
jgi:protein-S-isoprenylcysteine O-methyltransferase Ste14